MAREGLPNLVFERSYRTACRYLRNVRPGLGGASPQSSPHACRCTSTHASAITLTGRVPPRARGLFRPILRRVLGVPARVRRPRPRCSTGRGAARTPRLLWGLPPTAPPRPARPLRTACSNRMVRRCSAGRGGMTRACSARRRARSSSWARRHAARLPIACRSPAARVSRRPRRPPDLSTCLRAAAVTEGTHGGGGARGKDSCVLSSAATRLRRRRLPRGGRRAQGLHRIATSLRYARQPEPAAARHGQMESRTRCSKVCVLLTAREHAPRGVKAVRHPAYSPLFRGTACFLALARRSDSRAVSTRTRLYRCQRICCVHYFVRASPRADLECA